MPLKPKLLRRKARTTGLARYASPGRGIGRALVRNEDRSGLAMQTPEGGTTAVSAPPVFGALERTDPGGMSSVSRGAMAADKTAGFETVRGIDAGNGRYAFGLRRPGPAVEARPAVTDEQRQEAFSGVRQAGRDMQTRIGEQTNRMRTAFNSGDAGNRLGQIQGGFLSPRARRERDAQRGIAAQGRADTLQRDLATTQFVTGPTSQESERTRGVIGSAREGRIGEVGAARQGRLGVERTAEQDLEARTRETVGRSDVAGRQFPDQPTEISSQLLPGGGSVVAGPPGTIVVPPVTAGRLNLEEVSEFELDEEGHRIGSRKRFGRPGASGPSFSSAKLSRIGTNIKKIAEGDDRFGLANRKSRRSQLAADIGLPKGFDGDDLQGAVESGRLSLEMATEIADALNLE